ncbi:MAG: hypothetical protein JW706_08585 [Opitutales bacterium]|nr:hypothetical protein [Opitutales bacterium]
MTIILVLLIGIPFIVIAALSSIGSIKREKGAKKYLQVLGGVLVCIGGLGFFGTALSSSLGLPKSFEWPIGWADQIIPLEDGSMVAFHTPSGRVQVYDPYNRFLHGWSVDASGGVFKGKIVENGLIEIWTARGQKRFVFTREGSVKEQGSYSPASYDDFEVSESSGRIPIFFPLWLFAHPIIAWALIVAGILILTSSDRLVKKKTPKVMKRNTRRIRPENP